MGMEKVSEEEEKRPTQTMSGQKTELVDTCDERPPHLMAACLEGEQCGLAPLLPQFEGPIRGGRQEHVSPEGAPLQRKGKWAHRLRTGGGRRHTRCELREEREGTLHRAHAPTVALTLNDVLN